MTEYVQGAVSEGHPNELAESGGRGLCETAGLEGQGTKLPMS